MGGKDVCQRVRRVAAGLVTGHVRRLIKDQQVVVLIGDLDPAVGADEVFHPVLLAVQKGDGEGVPGLQQVDGADVPAVELQALGVVF